MSEEKETKNFALVLFEYILAGVLVLFVLCIIPAKYWLVLIAVSLSVRCMEFVLKTRTLERKGRNFKV